jgi:tRNA threonylcarbamoyladenosine biosynthesis protein TsaB
MLLAIDSATACLSIALHDGASLIAEETLQAANQHNTLLAPAVARLMQQTGTDMGRLTAVAACTGPGSYTGLRIGIALAKGVAGGRSLPLVGVSAPEVLAAAQPFISTRARLLVVLPAGRSRIITARFRGRRGRWAALDAPVNTTWEAALAAIETTTHITGEIDAHGREAIEAAIASGVPATLVPAAYRLRRAGFLAELAWQRLRATSDHEAFHAAHLRPIYLASDT